MKEDVAKNTVKGIALATAAFLPLGQDNSEKSKAETCSSFDTAAEIIPSRGVEESIFTVQCDFPGWFREEIRVPGTDVTLKMLRKPLMRLKCAEWKINISDWGIDIPLDGVSESVIRLYVVKQYLRLHRAAMDQQLTDADKECWSHMLKDVDYGDYCEQTAPMVWSVGKKVRTAPEGVYVSWSDNEEELLTGNFAEQLLVVSDGKSFTGMVKFRRSRLAALSNVSELSRDGAVADDLSWLT
jgi:hypothetical protein